mgnify:CR=1 FL=1
MDTEKKRGRGPAFKGLFHEPEQAVAAPQPGWEPLPPGSWLGVLGGGQLGRMFCQAAQRLGYRVCVLDPELDGIASRVADRHICAAYLDEAALQELGELCQAVTTEFENVPAAALERLAALTPAAVHFTVKTARNRFPVHKKQRCHAKIHPRLQTAIA